MLTQSSNNTLYAILVNFNGETYYYRSSYKITAKLKEARFFRGVGSATNSLNEFNTLIARNRKTAILVKPRNSYSNIIDSDVIDNIRICTVNLSVEE